MSAYTKAVKAREAGMKRAADHAEKINPGWSATALTFLTRFAKNNASFLAEEVVIASTESLSFPAPPDARSWGSVFSMANRKKIIQKTGRYRPAKSSHLSAKPVWARSSRA